MKGGMRAGSVDGSSGVPNTVLQRPTSCESGATKGPQRPGGTLMKALHAIALPSKSTSDFRCCPPLVPIVTQSCVDDRLSVRSTRRRLASITSDRTAEHAVVPLHESRVLSLSRTVLPNGSCHMCTAAATALPAEMFADTSTALPLTTTELPAKRVPTPTPDALQSPVLTAATDESCTAK
jgi:hypothetical protein